jgi:hypothetical protein
MKHYDSIPRIQDDGSLKGEMVVGYNKLDGQSFVASYNCRKKTWGPFGSRTVTVDENSEQFGQVVKWFKSSNYPETLAKIVKDYSGKGDVFTGVDEVTFVFEWYGWNSFAGKHQDGDEMHLALIDVFLKKKGYIEPKNYEMCFRNSVVEMPDLIYSGVLDSDIISKIQGNDWTQPDCWNSKVKEGVVFKRTTLLKGQRRPSVKVKTKWWIEKLHSMYTEEECKKLE